MTPISPFKHTITTNLTFDKCASVNMYFAVDSPPFETFTVYLSLFKKATNFDQSILNSLYPLSLNFIFEPHSIILLIQIRLFIFAPTMKLSIQERSNINTSINKIFLSLAIWKVILKFTFINRPITIIQHSLSFLNTVSPLATILSSISPITTSKRGHLAFLPFASVCPSTLFTKKGTLSILKAIFKITFIYITVRPFSSTVTTRISINKFTNINLVLTQNQFTHSLHFSFNPCTFIHFILIVF